MIKSALFLQASALTLFWSEAAFAQNAPPAATADPAASAPAPAPANPSATEIVVTGSRVITNGNNSPSPVTTVGTNELKSVLPGASLSDSLSILPAFAGSRGSTSNPSSTGSVGAGNGAASELNLRNLGVEKTLVLMDGHRLAPTVFSGLVDVDMIPEMLVQRVDVVTGGASAVYGSDAVSGVVNYIIDKKFNGLKANVNYGISNYNDDQTFNAGVAYGTKVGERGHLELSYEYRDEKGVLRRSDRPWARQAGITGLGTTADPYALNVDLRQSNYTFGGLITSGALANQTFQANGALSPFVHGTATGTAGIEIGGDGAYYDSSLIQPSHSNQLFGRFDYELTNNIRAYFQVSGNIKTSTNFADPPLLNKVTLSSTNAFLPATYQQQLAAAHQSTFKLSELMGMENLDTRNSAQSKSDQWMFNGGLEGALGKYHWNLDFMHGRSVLDTTVHDTVNNQKLAYALDAVNSGGKIVCDITITHPGLADDCVPLNVFGPSAASDAALNYVLNDITFHSVTTMDDLSGSFAGAPLNTWAGPVNMAVSGEWRRLAFNSVSNSTINSVVDCTGIRYNCTAGGALYSASFFSTPTVSERVAEAAYEVDVPLLKNLPFAQAFNVNGAVRYTDYNVSGHYWTWKAGFVWHVNDLLHFRGTISRDIRAPTLYDLFAPTNLVFSTRSDLLTGVTGPARDENGSNPNLKAEVGRTKTVGLVFTPSHQLSVALDYYRITVSNAITTVQGYTPEIQQACYASGGTSPYCALQIRPNGFSDTSASNTATTWLAVPINVAQVKTYGADLELNYRSRLFGRPFALRFLGAWQPHIYYEQPTVTTRDQGGAAFGPLGTSATPRLRATGLIHFEPMRNVEVDLMERWRSAMKLSGIPTDVFVSNHVDSFATTSATLGYNAHIGSHQAELYLNVSNLFNADPPVGGYTGNGGRAGLRDGFVGGDDVRGRYYTAGARIKF